MSYLAPFRRRGNTDGAGKRGKGKGKNEEVRRGDVGNKSSDRKRNQSEGQTEDIFEGLSEQPIKLWSNGSIADRVRRCAEGPIEVTNSNIIATYNWDNRSYTPSIVVPGAPKEFYEWSRGDLSAFFGQYRAANKDRSLDAMLMAARIMDTNFKLIDYDIVCDLEALAGLFRFCLDTATSIRMRLNQSYVAPWKIPGKDEGEVRIDVELIGSTIMMCREKEALKHAGGVGLKFLEECAVQPPTDMMIRDERVEGIYTLVKQLRIGDTRILVADTQVETARYPTSCTEVLYEVPESVKSMKVTIGGFKGHPNQLVPCVVASRKISELPTFLHPSKWLKQYLCSYPQCYVGRHEAGYFHSSQFKSLDEVKQLCGLDESAAQLWIKVLKCVLMEIIGFAKECDSKLVSSGKKVRFAVISDPAKKCMQIFGYKPDGIVRAVSDETLEWLMSTSQ